MPNWSDVLREIGSLQQDLSFQASIANERVRLKYLNLLHKHRKRNIIAYYSGFLSKPEVDSGIHDEDKNGFMMAVHKLDKQIGLDLILHTPGGGIAATHSLVDYLQKIFGKDIQAIVPQIAMSAGTMMACSCRRIYMAKHSNLGPIDPQLSGIPAQEVLQEFKRACREVKRDPSRIPIWQPIIGKYMPTFLGQCENAIKWSNSFVEDQLTNVMFENEEGAREKAKRIVKRLSDSRATKSHNRHLHAEQCQEIGLKIEMIEDDQELQDLVLTVHHCYTHKLGSSPACKVIENHLGKGLYKNVVPNE